MSALFSRLNDSSILDFLGIKYLYYTLDVYIFFLQNIIEFFSKRANKYDKINKKKCYTRVKC